MGGYWASVVRRAWADASQALGGLPTVALGILISALFVLPITVKIRNLPAGAQWSDAIDLWTLAGPAITIAVLLWFFLRAPSRIHSEQQAEIAQLTAMMRGRFEVWHDRECSACNAEEMGGQTLALCVEVRNVSRGNESLKGAALTIAAIEPRPRSVLDLPMTVASWDCLNPGEPATHARLFEHLSHLGLLRIRGSEGVATFPAGDYAITLIAHAENMPPSTVRFQIRKTGAVIQTRGGLSPQYGLGRVD